MSFASRELVIDFDVDAMFEPLNGMLICQIHQDLHMLFFLVDQCQETILDQIVEFDLASDHCFRFHCTFIDRESDCVQRKQLYERTKKVEEACMHKEFGLTSIHRRNHSLPILL